MYACLEREIGANALVTIIELRNKIPVDSFGGVFFAKSSRTDINKISDISGQRLEGVDLVGLGAGQAQWREFVNRGYSFFNLPSQLLLSANQNQIITDVLNNVTDVRSTPAWWGKYP